MQALRKLRPRYVRDFLQTWAAISGTYLNAYYEGLWKKLRAKINLVLRKGFGTIVFDGWEDSTSCAIVNVLFRVEGLTTNIRKTYFLESIFTESNRMGINAYVELFMGVMSEYGGM